MIFRHAILIDPPIATGFNISMNEVMCLILLNDFRHANLLLFDGCLRNLNFKDLEKIMLLMIFDVITLMAYRIAMGLH